MRKWGLHYIGVILLAAVLAGCSASSDNNSASNAMANTGAAQLAKSASSLATTEAEAAPAAIAEKANGENGAMAAFAGNEAQIETDNAGATAGFTGNDVVAGLNKKLIYKANLVMEVNDYAKAQTEVRNMVTLAKGYIIQFNENMSDYEQGGTFVMKLPAAGFSPFLNNLEKVEHETLQRSIEGQDVSEEYVDLESRLKAKQLMEDQYTEFMKKATKSSDLVAFANELGKIQEAIEQMKGRMRYIDQNVAFSTVELRLYETDKSISVKKQTEQGPLLERASDALSGSLKVISTLFQWLVIALAAALPVLIAAAVVLAAVIGYRRFKRSRSEEEHSQQAGRIEQSRIQAQAGKPEQKEEDE